MTLDKGPVLAIDTVTEKCTVAISSECATFQLCESGKKSHSQHILAMVHEVLRKLEVRLQSLSAIAVNIGPGSFTGVRIGIGVAQGLAYASKIPVLGFCSLEALAIKNKNNNLLVLSALDARMGQIYYAKYRPDSNKRPVLLTEPKVINPQSMPPPPESPYICVGNGWDMYHSSLEPLGYTNHNYSTEIKLPEAKSLLSLVEMMGTEVATDPIDLQAYYVRNEVAKKSSK